MIERPEEQDGVGTSFRLRKATGITHLRARKRRSRLGLRSCGRLLDVQRYRIDQVYRVAFPGQRQRVSPGSTSDIEYRSRSRRQIAGEKLPRPRVLQPSRSPAQQAFLLRPCLVVGQYLRVELAPFTDRSHPLVNECSCFSIHVSDLSDATKHTSKRRGGDHHRDRTSPTGPFPYSGNPEASPHRRRYTRDESYIQRRFA